MYSTKIREKGSERVEKSEEVGVLVYDEDKRDRCEMSVRVVE